MRGSLIPTAKRLTNRTAPIDPSDMSEANANNYMFLFDNLASGDYISDSAILPRHLLQVRAREQATPNMTLEVSAGLVWFALNSYINFAGGNSPAFSAPVTDPRIDVLTIRSDGSLYVIQGTEAASPAVPTIPSTDIPIAQVYNVVGETVIHDNDAQVAGQGYIQYDLRPFIQVAVGSSAMPKIGLVARVNHSCAAFPGGYSDAVNYTGAGRLLGVNFNVAAGVGSMDVDVIIDGVTYTLAALAAATDNKLIWKAGNSATMFDTTATAAAFTELAQGIFFKSSLRIRHQMTAGVNIGTVVAVYEHE